MVNPLNPEDVVVTINGSTFTTKLFTFEEGGGERTVSYRRGLNRKHKVARTEPSDFVVSFSGTVSDLSFEDVWSVDDTMSISLDWPGSYNITYNEVRPTTATYSMDSEDRLLVESEFTGPFYTFNGSRNRSVTQ